MTPDHELERLLDGWLADGPIDVPDRVLDAMTARIAREPQRPAWRLRPWRTRSMPASLRLALVAAALLTALVGGSILLTGGGSRSVTASPVPLPASLAPAPASASAAASPAAVDCEDGLPGCAGPLVAGEVRSQHLVPGISFTAPAGWTNQVDTPTIYSVDTGTDAIMVWTNAEIVTLDDQCNLVPVGSSSRAADWAFAVTHTFELGMAPAKPVSVGGLDGTWLTVTIPDGEGTRCGHADAPEVPFLRNVDPVAGTQVYGSVAGRRVLIHVVDVGDRTVVLWQYAPDDEISIATAQAATFPFLSTLRFR